MGIQNYITTKKKTLKLPTDQQELAKRNHAEVEYFQQKFYVKGEPDRRALPNIETFKCITSMK